MTVTARRPRAPQLRLPDLIAELQHRPGEWYEVARYPAARRKTAWSRGSQTCARYPELDYGVSEVDGEAVLYFQAIPVVP